MRTWNAKSLFFGALTLGTLIGFSGCDTGLLSVDDFNGYDRIIPLGATFVPCEELIKRSWTATCSFAERSAPCSADEATCATIPASGGSAPVTFIHQQISDGTDHCLMQEVVPSGAIPKLWKEINLGAAYQVPGDNRIGIVPILPWPDYYVVPGTSCTIEEQKK